MKVLLTKKFFPKDIEYIKKRVDKRIEFINEDNFELAKLADQVKDAEILFGGLITEELLRLGSKIKFIQVPWTGVDSLDWALLSKYGVEVCNSHSNATVVAEHAIGLMFDASKKIGYHDRQMRVGNWNRLFPNANIEVSPFSSSIRGSHIGIIGFGAIGKSIYQLLSGFQCEFSAFSKSGHSNMVHENLNLFPIKEIDEKLKSIQFLFVTVPFTEGTKGLVDEKIFSQLGNECVLINVSRGEVINQKDLYTALKDKEIAWAGIDTWYNYPSIKKQVAFPSEEFAFHELNNITMSPHRAGYNDSGLPHLDDAIENLNRAVIGKPLINVVSTKKRY